ncbi:MAG: NAD(P)/FAD-dependent oxidoreductase [Paracoccaceae bacterium]
MPTLSSKVIVIGGGVNGLACAARLADAGHKVTLVEAAPQPGGAMALAQFTPGIDPRVLSGMDLAAHGLRFHPALSTTVLSADGQHLTVAKGRIVSGLDGQAAAEAEATFARLSRFASALAPFRAMTPPRLTAKGNEWGRLAKLGLGIRAMGKAEFREFLRMILINVHDVAMDELSDDRLRGLLAFDATLGAWLGPRSPNSLILYLNRLAMGGSLVPKGGMAAVADAMTKAAQAKGVTIRCNARVVRILTEADQAAGVELDSGEKLHADLVVSAIGPKATFRDLVGARHLDAGFHARTAHIRARGAAARLDLTLSAAPDFRGANPAHRLVIAPSSEAVESAWNPVKYGEVPDRPVMQITLPHALEGGTPRLSAVVQFAPHAPADRAAAKAQMLANTLAVLEDHAPGIGALIAQADLLMPWEIEEKFGLAGGNWHNGELAVEQMLFLRPLAGAAQYETPLPRLWLAGSGSHPGGWVTGTAGWSAAERILKGVA